VPPGSTLRVTDTRKTTPGLRALERYAVRTGGGFNHRDQLGSAILIKDNHIALAGGIAPAVESARRRAPHTSRIEVEVESLDALDEALAAGAEVVMLDNFTDELVAEGVRRAKGRALVEVSGGVTLERISTLARLGVDVVSVGALTHSAPAADISLELGALGAPGAG
jgi:nicotinate-nucleotide pyrophosphorylase (carboxylating)